MRAILRNKIGIVRTLILRGINVNRTINGRNAFTCILQMSDNEIDNRIIEELIQAGGDVNYVEPVTGVSLLMRACMLDRRKLINNLVQHVNVNYTTPNGRNAMLSAQGNQDVINILLANGAVAIPVAPAGPAPAGPAARIPEVIPQAEENNPFAKRLQCTICMIHAVNTRLNPCGHLICSTCFAQLPTTNQWGCSHT